MTYGDFHVPIEIGDLPGQRYERIDAPADTDATYTLVPASRLRALGIDIGQALAGVNGQAVTTLVVFGDDDMETLLGAYTLEGLRLAVDPASRRLVSVPARLM